jgi:hypothetical protein
LPARLHAPDATAPVLIGARYAAQFRLFSDLPSMPHPPAHMLKASTSLSKKSRKLLKIGPRCFIARLRKDFRPVEISSCPNLRIQEKLTVTIRAATTKSARIRRIMP